MRWQALFADLEGQLAEEAAADLRAEVSDRTRREAARVGTIDKLRAAVGQPLTVAVSGGARVQGTLVEAGPDWLLLEETAPRDLLIPLSAVLTIGGLGSRAASPGSEGEVARRLDLRWALRGLARSRLGLSVLLTDGSSLEGTLDRVGADYVDIAEHPVGEPRRPGVVRSVRLVPLTALNLLRSG